MKSRTDVCKICGARAVSIFDMPVTKLTGHPIPADGSAPNCSYFECSACGFVFTPDTDHLDQSAVYDADYWDKQDGGWYGRASETLRLVMMASSLIGKPADSLSILDFGCGMGGPLNIARNLGLDIWGTDINEAPLCKDRYLSSLAGRTFDVIVACEVLEHLTDPVGVLRTLTGCLNDGGVLAFQTAYWDSAVCGRDWWYVGPANGHISFYSPRSFDRLAARLGVRRRLSWNGYAGLQAWQIGGGGQDDCRVFAAGQLRLSPNATRLDNVIRGEQVPEGQPVCYGPYVDVEAGDYQLMLVGEMGGPCQVRITCDCGRQTILRTEWAGPQSVLSFSLATPARDFECVVFRGAGGTPFRLTSIILARHGDGDGLGAPQ
jgi:SAM-dependent methyltransferase